MTKRPHNPLLTLLAVLAVLIGCTSASAQTDSTQDPPAADPADGASESSDTQSPEPADPPADEPGPWAGIDAELRLLLEAIETASSDTLTMTSRMRYTRVQGLTGDIQQRFGNFFYQAEQGDAAANFAVHFDRLLVDGNAREMSVYYAFDGQWLLERDDDDMTATRRELVPEQAVQSGSLNFGDGQVLIPLRLDAEQIITDYTVNRLPDEVLLTDEDTGAILQANVVLELTPPQDDTPITLWFDSETHLLQKVVTDDNGDQVELLFRNHVLNPDDMPADTFSTELPRGNDWQVQEVPLD